MEHITPIEEEWPPKDLRNVSDIEFELIDLITRITQGAKWEHKFTQTMPDGRINIQIYVRKEKKPLEWTR